MTTGGAVEGLRAYHFPTVSPPCHALAMDDESRLKRIGEAIEYGVMAVFVAGAFIAGLVGAIVG